ncbi:MAG: recombination protein RecR [Spirochaetales bacterium]|nr:recombination protein RecR [Spirochaetales bacterium]
METLTRLVRLFSKLPGLGPKSANRIVYHLLKCDKTYIEALSKGLEDLIVNIKECSVCGNYTDCDPCSLCSDPSRQKDIICVVEEPKDIQAIEGTGEYTGVYHVLMGVISPINGIGPSDLRIPQLLNRIGKSKIQEIILATNPTVEGDTTALYLLDKLKSFHVRVSRLALGLPMGGDLEYADRLTLARAFSGRQEIN